MKLPKVKGTGKFKVLALVLLAVGLYFVVTDPAGSAASVNGIGESVSVFWQSAQGGGQS